MSDKQHQIFQCNSLKQNIPNTAVFGPTNFIGTTTIASNYGTDEDLDEDFYGGRTGPLEKFYLFIYFLLI